MMSSQTTVQTNDYLPENQVIKARKTAASNASFEVIEQQMRDKVGRKIHALRLQAPSGNGRTTVANEVPIIFQQCQLPVCTSTAASRRNSYRSVLQKLPTHYRSSLNVASQPSMLTSSLGSVTSWNRPLLRCSSYNELATSCRNNAKTESNLQLLPVSPSSVDDKFATFSNRALPPADDYYDDPKSKTGDIVNDINASDIEIHAVESALCQVVTVDDKATESVSQVEVTQKTAGRY
jgi:hypothetical protein